MATVRGSNPRSRMKKRKQFAGVAQGEEQASHKRKGGGSNPPFGIGNRKQKKNDKEKRQMTLAKYSNYSPMGATTIYLARICKQGKPDSFLVAESSPIAMTGYAALGRFASFQAAMTCFCRQILRLH